MTSVTLIAAPYLIYGGSETMHSLAKLIADQFLFVGQTNVQRRCDTTEGTRYPERESTWEVAQWEQSWSIFSGSSAAALTVETPACKWLWLTDLLRKKSLYNLKESVLSLKGHSYIFAYYTYSRSSWCLIIILIYMKKNLELQWKWVRNGTAADSHTSSFVRLYTH